MKRYLISTAALAMSTLMLSTAVWADASQSRYFVDMNDQSYGFWAIDEVDSLCQAGIVKGVGDNKFAPESLMKRGDFVLMLENAFEYPAIYEGKYNFADVKQDDYYFTAINNARGNGIVDDTPVFNPQDPIKRIDAFNMIYNTMHLYECIGSNGSTDVSMYSDSSLLLNTKDKISVGTLTKLGIVSGSNGEIKPNDTVTRAEMAVMLSKAVEVYQNSGSTGANTGTKQELKPILSGAEAHPDPDRVASTAEKITETYKVIDGETVEIKDAEIAVDEGDGVVAQGDGTEVYITDTKASTAEKGSTVVSVEDGAEAELDGVEINSSAKESTGVYVDKNSEATIESSKIFARYDNSLAVESKGTLTVDDSTLQSAKSDAVKLHSGTETSITDSSIIVEGSHSGIVITNDDSSYDTVTLNLTDVDFSGSNKSSAIKVENAKAVINIKNVTLDGIKTLLETAYNYNRGMKETNVTINLDKQKLEGAIEADEMSIINLNLTNGSTFKGVLNYANTAKSMNVEISGDSVLELTDDCYVDAFVVTDETIRSDRNFTDIINDKGSTIYYNADNHENDYLNDGTYSLRNGGVLTPASK
jgi:hypothetical protein